MPCSYPVVPPLTIPYFRTESENRLMCRDARDGSNRVTGRNSSRIVATKADTFAGIDRPTRAFPEALAMQLNRFLLTGVALLATVVCAQDYDQKVFDSQKWLNR